MRGGRTAMAVLGALMLLAILGPAASPWSPAAIDWAHVASPPTLANSHWLGTDALGRDLYARMVQGLRVSLAIGVLATAVAVCVGVVWGAVAGYAGGRADAAMMRVVDALYSLPFVFVAILVIMAFDRHPVAVFAALGAFGWLTMARIVRAEARTLRTREFVVAAVAAGAPPTRILRRHVVPNLAGAVVAYATLMVPQMILAESFLSFLGLGIQQPLASLGNLMAEGAARLEQAPWMLLVPCGVLVVLVLALNAAGDALRASLEPRGR